MPVIISWTDVDVERGSCIFSPFFVFASFCLWLNDCQLFFFCNKNCKSKLA